MLNSNSFKRKLFLQTKSCTCLYKCTPKVVSLEPSHMWSRVFHFCSCVGNGMGRGRRGMPSTYCSYVYVYKCYKQLLRQAEYKRWQRVCFTADAWRSAFSKIYLKYKDYAWQLSQASCVQTLPTISKSSCYGRANSSHDCAITKGTLWFFCVCPNRTGNSLVTRIPPCILSLNPPPPPHNSP